MKFKVLEKCTLVVEQNSIVELDPKQAKLAIEKGLVCEYKVQEKKETKKKKKEV